MIICICARTCGTFGLIGLLKLCGYEKDKIDKLQWNELAFISFAGLIRGAIAFGLVLRLDPHMANRSVIVTTCLTLVVFTTVVFGSTIGVLEKCLFKNKVKPDREQEVDELLSNNTRNTANNYNKLKVLYEQKKVTIEDKMTSLHYNAKKMLEENAEEAKDAMELHGQDQLEFILHQQKTKTCCEACVHYTNILDEKILGPVFIHKYEKA
jgi:NhaP-type Na+/H+ or K+/H+ antiporter